MSHTREGRPQRDEGVRTILAIGGTFLGAVAVSVFVADLYDDRAERPPTTGEGPRAVARTFPRPRLQQTPAIDLAEIRRREEERLSGYTWVDRDEGVVRVPVEVAVEAIVQRGRRLGEEGPK